MELLGLPILQDFKRKHANVRKTLDAWQVEAECSHWQTSHDIKQRYPSAEFLVDGRVIFNIKGNHYRLVVKVRYQRDLVIIEWVGTHADYDKQSF